jgi:hypothetical protein
MTPDPYQTRLLSSDAARILILATRQAGKSLTAAALSLKEAFLRPGSKVLLLSPTLRQSAELFKDKVMPLYHNLGRPVPKTDPRDNALRLELANGSRILCLPGKEANIRGFASVALLVIDEAARVPDALYHAVRPMLAVSGGKLVCLSSAYARQGFFYEAWSKGGPSWERACIKASECSRISPEFLAEERAELGERVYSREYECEFTSADDAAFDLDAIERACAAAPSGPALF